MNECERPKHARGFCPAHYSRWRRWGTPDGIHRLRDEVNATCRVEGCGRPTRAKGLCNAHYEQMRRTGSVHARKQRPRGTGTLTKQGYVVHQRVVDGRKVRILEHRRVMEDALGRPLFPDETVHHKHGNRADNRLEKLELWTGRHPKGQRAEDVVEYAVEMLERYAPHLLAVSR